MFIERLCGQHVPAARLSVRRLHLESLKGRAAVRFISLTARPDTESPLERQQQQASASC